MSATPYTARYALAVSRPSKPKPPSKQELAVAASLQESFHANDLKRVWEDGVEAIKRFPESHPINLLLALTARKLGRFDLARQHAERSLRSGTHPQALLTLAEAERRDGNTDAALTLLDRASAMLEDRTALQIQRAGVLEEAGRIEEARSAIEPLIRELESRGSPLPVALRFELSKILVQEKAYEDAIGVIDGVFSEQTAPDQLAVLLGYLKAKALDRSGRFDEAFDAASAANKIGRIEFDPALYEAQVTTLIENWSAERMERFPISSCMDELPVFVAGMPRSGTSLIDQIIDAHPAASGVGELGDIEQFASLLSQAYNPDLEPPRCFGRYDSFRWTRVAQAYFKQIRAMAPSADRVVNKALGNNKLVGLLARLFPKTRIIHAMRDPRDVAISCYIGGFNNQMHAWTTRLEWAACAWEQSERMMDHWKHALGVPILDIRYEQLVRDPGTQFPRLIEFLGLPWDESCQRFYESKRTVRTLSYDQVNRPLYTTSAGRHANYYKQLSAVEFPAYGEP